MSKADYLARRVVAFEFGGQTHYVRPMTGAQVESLVSNEADQMLDGARALTAVCCYCACDEKGERLFEDDDLAELRSGGDFALVKVAAAAAMEASGLGDDSGND